MPRSISGNLQTILDGPARDIDWTIDLIFPTTGTLKIATSSIEIGGDDYVNDVEDISEIRQTLESPTDRVNVTVQNKDSVLGLHFANNQSEWHKAEAIIGRVYRGSGLEEWIEMFRGAVQQPNVTDFTVTFDVLTDTIAPGQIVSDRTLALACPSVFKDPKTCAYTGAEDECDHHLKSKGGCDGRGNAVHFAGFENRYNPDSNVPGTGGNNTGGGGFPCPRLDQFILVSNGLNLPTAKLVGELMANDLLFNPITKSFHAIKSLTIFKQVEIFELSAENNAKSFSSCSHKVLVNREDSTGQVVTKFKEGDSILTWIDDLTDSKVVIAKTEKLGDVMKIEMANGHIYCSGNTPDKLIVAHNAKSPLDL